jgi:hypothetical protein
MQEPGSTHELEEPGLDLFGHDPHREIEGMRTGVPTVIGGVEGSGGYHIMDMRMVLQVPAPGVQHAEEAGSITGDRR